MSDKIRFDIMVGFPGSGKSTWAQEQAEKHGCLIVSRDALRYMVTGGTYKYDSATEPAIKNIAMDAVAELLASGHDVIVDETNITRLGRDEWLRVIEDLPENISTRIATRFVWCVQNSQKKLLSRRMSDPRGMSADLWRGVIRKMDDAFEPPTFVEGVEIYVIAT